MGSLKKEMVSGVAWLTISKYSALIVQFVVTIIISRILSPEDYGIIGFLYVFLAIGSILLDSGFGQALIQKGKEVKNIDYCFCLLCQCFYWVFIIFGVVFFSTIYSWVL